MTIRFLIAACFLLVFAHTQAHAQNNEKLTPDTIQAFLDESSLITHPETGKSKEDIQDFLKKHISSRADFVTNIVYDIEGYPPQTRKIELGRPGFIKNVTDSVGKFQDYSSYAKLIEHDITNGGRKADIVVITSEKGMMQMQDQMVPFDGKTRCSQIIRWKTPHGIVVESASCETILSISEN